MRLRAVLRRSQSEMDRRPSKGCATCVGWIVNRRTIRFDRVLIYGSFQTPEDIIRSFSYRSCRPGSGSDGPSSFGWTWCGLGGSPPGFRPGRWAFRPPVCGGSDAARYRGATVGQTDLRQASRVRCAARSFLFAALLVRYYRWKRGEGPGPNGGIRAPASVQGRGGAERGIIRSGGRQLSGPGPIPRRFHTRRCRPSFRLVRTRRPAGGAQLGGPMSGAEKRSRRERSSAMIVSV